MSDSFMELMWRTSHVQGSNAVYVEELYETYLRDPNDVPEEWRGYFDKLPQVESGQGKSDVPHGPIREHFLLLAKNRNSAQPQTARKVQVSEYQTKQVAVLALINAYRQRGHQRAALDPLQLQPREQAPDLDLQYHQLTVADYDTVFQTGSFSIGDDQASLGEIVSALDQTYCSSIGAEYMHIVDSSETNWIAQRLESVRCRPKYGNEVKQHLLERLTAAEGLERYLGTRFAGAKRFGVEGGEALIPLLDELIQRSGSYGAAEIVLGMAHRGRLNVLVNILGKTPSDLFDEFEGKVEVTFGSGDVKYHQGFSSNVMTPGGEIHLALSFNPSHLEIVSPVVEGSVRARQDRRNDPVGDKVVPIIIHGDAAFAGQGVVMETFQMSQTRGYKTGGTIHVVLNNQVGFTTSKREDARSTEYCTDIAKMVQAPIFHVNGDDPEAVLFVTQVAMDFRNQFKKDVVIDLICYRRRGHNEADEPSITQPIMYKKIRSHDSVRTLYAQQLIVSGVLTEAQVQGMTDDYRLALETGTQVLKSLVKEPNEELFVDWEPYLGHDWTVACDTTFSLERLKYLDARMAQLPPNFPLQRQVTKIIDDRKRMAAGAMPINWGFAEVMAYASLVDQGSMVRITGQDVGRGTFSHRHAKLLSQHDGEEYIPLQHVSEGQAPFVLYDSLLSEAAVLGFEYGYSTTTPGALVIWEAQFGDFANGAQVVIDQFITSGEHKWGRLCGLTLLLPHGYEGQGPEHSSARLERYLQMAAEHNIQVCMPSTPAQVFHMLRRQALRPLRKPLIVMTPKSLLRHKLAVSTVDELVGGQFHNVLPELDEDINPEQVTRVVLCAGKVYFDLLERRRASDCKDVAIVRMEQLYPFPEQELAATLKSYANLDDVVWCQEEPQNQGAWYSSQHHMRKVILQHDDRLYLNFAGREPSAAPAAGTMSLHVAQQEQLIEDALFG